MTTARPILVTGGAGFIGGHVRLALAARGYRVRSLDLTTPRTRLADEQIMEGSVTDMDQAMSAVDGAAGVIHGAALAHLWRRDPMDFDRVNVEGTANMIQAARVAGIPFLHLSSFTTLVGRTARDGDILDETVAVAPSDLLGAYPRSKRRAERLVEDAASEGLHALSVLPSAPVGPGDRGLTPPSAMIRDLAAGKTPGLVDCLLNLVDVQALADGIVTALEKGRSGERYLLCGEDLPMSDLAERVARISGTPAPRWTVPMPVALLAGRVEGVTARISGIPPQAPLTGVRLAARRVRFDGTKAARDLGFRPPPIDKALAGAIAWMRSEGLLTMRDGS
ncbi:MAG: NAD-dependent epimerase/dehydratase family protein [Alphaproteobacteria bacterium]|nr:NAD-dependent epimerase/dehydratase family protein [Alphaproteobacteria bacterium]